MLYFQSKRESRSQFVWIQRERTVLAKQVEVREGELEPICREIFDQGPLPDCLPLLML